MRHIDDGMLEGWLDRPRSGISATDAAAIESHLEECAACSSRAEAARLTRGRAAGILEGARPRAIEPPPFETIAARASRPRTRPQERVRPFVAAAWAASVVAAVGLGWFAREVLRSEQVALQESVAPATVAAGEPAAGYDAVMAPEAAPAVGAASTESAAASAEPAARAQSAARPEVAPEGAPRSPAVGIIALGRVTDPAGQPLSNAQVTARGTGAGVLTGPDGRYSLEVESATPSAPLTLAARRIGFVEATATLLESTSDTIAADFQLPAASVALDAVTVTGVQQRSLSSGAPSAAAAPPAPPAPPPAVGDAAAASVQGAVGVSVESGWRFTNREHAESLLGRPILLVPDLPLLRVQVRPSGNGIVVRVVQGMTGGGELTLDQSPAGAGVPAPVVEPGSALVTTRRGDLVIQAFGAMNEQTLRRLVDTAR